MVMWEDELFGNVFLMMLCCLGVEIYFFVDSIEVIDEL